MKPTEPLERFDGASAWAMLKPEDQAAIGAIALEYIIAVSGRDAYGDVDGIYKLARPFEAAEPMLASQLFDAVEGALWPSVAAIGDDAALWPVPLRLGRVCRTCACSDNDGCPEGCAWAEDDLCTVCKELEAA